MTQANLGMLVDTRAEMRRKRDTLLAAAASDTLVVVRAADFSDNFLLYMTDGEDGDTLAYYHIIPPGNASRKIRSNGFGTSAGGACFG